MVRMCLVSLVLLTSSLIASPKDDLVNAIMSQCSKNRADAEALATPGRTGTVVKFQFCHSPVIETDDPNCKVTCSKGSSTIGG